MKGFILCLALMGCAGAVVAGAGCITYGNLRSSMPALGDDALSVWVARLDASMTGACR
jgi:hypothetical protein